LLSKLKTYVITGTDKEHYQSYLKDRYERVLISNETQHHSTLSNWILNIHGVPQGSILGPLIFLLYINELPQLVNNKSTTISFDDDKCILFTHTNTTEFN